MVAADASIAVYMMSSGYQGTLYIGVTSQFLRASASIASGLGAALPKPMD